MASYMLATERMRLVKKNDRDKVIKRRTFKRGETITSKDLSGFDVEDWRVDALVEKGTLVDPEVGLPNQDEATLRRAAAVLGGLSGAATAPSADHSDLDDDEDVEPVETEDDIEVEEVDEYSEMDYPTLQQTAKTRDLNAGGSADDLRARLREANAS